MPAYDLPYTGAGPMPGTGVTNIQGIVLVDPTTGDPVSPATAGGGVTPPTQDNGVSASGSVDTGGADIVVPAGAYKRFCTVQNTHATQILYLGFAGPITTADIAILPGGSITFPAPFANALRGLGSGAGTTFARIGV